MPQAAPLEFGTVRSLATSVKLLAKTADVRSTDKEWEEEVLQEITRRIMYIKQSKNTFIRFFNDEAYLTNQLTRFDRVYNETGADFLREISRTPRKIDVILSHLAKVYGDSVTPEELASEFSAFISELVRTKFLIMGDDASTLDDQDMDFSYSMENPKTMVNNYTQESKDIADENTQNFMLEATQRVPRLNSLQFELTSRCNERCIHCYIPNPKKNEGKDMPLEKVKSIIDEFAASGGLHVTLSGGEVFMHKDIIHIIQYCREKDMMITILSNLIALKDVQIPFLKAANISGIQVSLYSMNAENHDRITTVKGSFEKTKNAIEKLVAADIPVMISCPVMKANRNDYKDILKYAQSIRCKAHTDFLIMAQANLDTQNLANRLSLEETEQLLRDIVENDIDYKQDTLTQENIISLRALDLERFKKMPLCGAAINSCCIAENGDVYPCAGWQDYVLGNVYEQTLEDIWQNSEKAEKVRAVTEGDFPQCVECEARDYCARCLVRNYNESEGDMFKINKHFCDVAFLNKRIVEEHLRQNEN